MKKRCPIYGRTIRLIKTSGKLRRHVTKLNNGEVCKGSWEFPEELNIKKEKLK